MNASCIELSSIDAEDDKQAARGDMKRDRVKLIGTENHWRCPVPAGEAPGHPDHRILVSRWSLERGSPTEFANSGADYHTVCLSLAPMMLTFRVGGRVVFDGHVGPGVTQVTSPGRSVAAAFHSGCDVLHLFVPQSTLAQFYEEACGRAHPGDIVIADPRLSYDPSLEKLGSALAEVQECDPSFGSLYADSICIAITSRLLARQFANLRADPLGSANALSPQRVRRAIEYIDAHLQEPIGLADVPASIGLSRMHFAAQFRAATGVSPHQFLLNRRLEHAKYLLLKSDESVIDIAFLSGFRSHAHFTATFKRVTGDTPTAWKRRARGHR
jgi:AraC family transcriptional regulator